MLSASLVLPFLESPCVPGVGRIGQRRQEGSTFVVVSWQSGNKDPSGSERKVGLCLLIQVVAV